MPKVWLHPSTAERNYARLFLSYWRELQSETLRRLKERGLKRFDADEPQQENDWSDALTVLLAALGLWSAQRVQVYRIRLLGIADQVNLYNDNEFRKIVAQTVGIQLAPSGSFVRQRGAELVSDPKTIQKVFGESFDIMRHEPWVQDVINNWIAYNVLQFQAKTKNYLQDVELIVRNMIVKGASQTEIINALKQRGLKDENKIKLLVRDQITKIDANFTEWRQRSLGLTKYRWRTVGDLHVRGDPDGLYPNARPSHYARDNQIFEWNKPPENGHPGEDYGCRCRAEMVFENFSKA